jgi:hypothetical protein
MSLQDMVRGVRRASARDAPGEAKEEGGIEETSRHYGLDPESRIVLSRATRRKNLIDELDSGSSPE